MPIRFFRFGSRFLTVAIAVIAVFMVLARAPEEVRVESTDGRMSIVGAAPRRLLPLRIEKEKSFPPREHTAVVSSIYSITPSDALFPQPLRLEYRYNDDLIETNPLAVALARYNASASRWEPAASQVDFRKKSVYADVRIFSRWTVLRLEDIKIPGFVSALADEMITDAPADAVGFTIDIEYARVSDDFVLIRPAYRAGGCRGLLEGKEKQQIRETVKENEIWYRLTLTWEKGGRERCNVFKESSDRNLENP